MTLYVPGVSIRHLILNGLNREKDETGAQQYKPKVEKDKGEA